MNVEQWVEVFRATGLDEAMMQRWHQEFERLHPDQHERFLHWLGLPGEAIARIRLAARPA